MTKPTSLAALHSISSPVMTDLETAVLRVVTSAGVDGLIADEIEAKTGLPWQTISPRLAPLERKGLVIRAGDTRKACSGRQQLVVRASEFLEHPALRDAKMRRNAKLQGLLTAAKIVIEAETLEQARLDLKAAILKAVKRTAPTA